MSVSGLDIFQGFFLRLAQSEESFFPFPSGRREAPLSTFYGILEGFGGPFFFA